MNEGFVLVHKHLGSGEDNLEGAVEKAVDESVYVVL